MTVAALVPQSPRYARVAPEQIDSVLAALTRGATLAAACSEAGCSYAAVWAKTQRDSEFAERVADAKAQWHGAIIEEARKRVFDGVEKTIFHAGAPCGVEKRKSDRLLLALLQTVPEYAARKTVTHDGQVTHTVAHTESNALPLDVFRTLDFSVQAQIRRAVILSAHKKGLLTADQALEKLCDVLLDARERGHDIGDERAFAELPNVVDVEAEEIEVDSDVEVPNFL